MSEYVGLIGKDRRILREIELNARASYSSIGKRLQLSKETVKYRIQHLESRGIIAGYIPIIDVTQLGYMPFAVYAQLRDVKGRTRSRILRLLQSSDRVYWVAHIGGQYDLIFGIQALSTFDFHSIFQQLQNEIGDVLRKTSILARLRSSQFRRTYLTRGRLAQFQPSFGESGKSTAIDSLDRELLNDLAANARVTISDLARNVGASRNTVRERIDRLEQSGVIQGYAAVVKSQYYGYQVYQLLIKTRIDRNDIMERIRSYAAQHPNFTFFTHVMGSWNVELTVEVPSQRILSEILSDLRNAFSSEIVEAEAVINFDHLAKYRYYP